MNALVGLAWAATNVLIGYSALVLLIFVVGYFVMFDPKATTAGRLIFRFMTSLVGVMLLVVVGIFVDPEDTTIVWYTYPENSDGWKIYLRLIVYAYLAYTITSLAVVLAIRKWEPQLVKKASDLEIVKLRNSSPIPTVKKGRRK